ncbi:RNA-guided endonuclease InsQ/TnpB family protein [Halobacterium salinarum]|uniref:Transposase n=1 Tax=Halobacterium salinarum (strain ATCC 33171 / DSM 3754 / JCM 8978 / NBRC 102687 / NCIMB 764 / 91-R6) TaxID=2597657 RepID=A0A4D6GSZ1_HALS9|nr:RNA-guided endonuclease TnpB family protein [Halobacterium salinarum]QCC44884.1 IS1341-type transposase [Halobacterium salinarum]TYO75532.1 transposase [Halobacterium salinarum DSM 3754]
MELQRTAVVKLSVPNERQDDLKRTMDTFRDASQRFADRGWQGDDSGYVITSRSRLQPLVYDDIREDTGLHSDLTVAAVNHASDALSGCVDRMKEGERTSKPVFTSNTTVYNTNAITYFDGYCSLAAYGSGRVHAEYVYPDDSLQAEYMEGDEWTKQGAKLRYDCQSDTYYLHVSVKQEREDSSEGAESRTVLGVDRNVDGYLAVTSTGAFIGNADLLNHKRREYERRRNRLQQTGTRNAHLTIQSIGDTFANWSEDFLHQASKRLVKEAASQDCSVIVFEDLKRIRDRISGASKFQQWAFRELKRQAEYKARAHGIAVESVHPAYTSQRCSHTNCGFTHEDNRDGDEFACQKCGKELHSDYNAARNIAHRYVQNRLKSGSGRATNHLALKSGTLNGNGDYSPSTV